jgi:hypothetical protein
MFTFDYHGLSYTNTRHEVFYFGSLCLSFLTMALAYFTLMAPRILRMLLDTWKILVALTVDKIYLLT